LRDVPIITFVNKLDREARDPFDLLDEIEQALALDVTPASWPIGMGRDFLGTYDLFADALLLEPKVAGFVFKVQANIDPQHRDRIAFVRIASGRFQRGMKLKNIRTGRLMSVQAWPGDIIGIPNHGSLRIGDTLTEGEAVRITGLPSFAPEILQRVKVEDPMKSKHLKHALEQLAEEGVTRVFKPLNGGDWIVGVVGALQLDMGPRGSPPNTTCPPASMVRPFRRRAGSTPTTGPSSIASATGTPRPAPRTMTGCRSFSPATPGICARRSRYGRISVSRRRWSGAETAPGAPGCASPKPKRRAFTGKLRVSSPGSLRAPSAGPRRYRDGAAIPPCAEWNAHSCLARRRRRDPSAATRANSLVYCPE
jgi:hypothetical protein